jgi:hypothetical protein
VTGLRAKKKAVKRKAATKRWKGYSGGFGVVRPLAASSCDRTRASSLSIFRASSMVCSDHLTRAAISSRVRCVSIPLGLLVPAMRADTIAM